MTKNNNAIVFRSCLLYFMDYSVLFEDSDHHKVGQGVGLVAPWPEHNLPTNKEENVCLVKKRH